MHVYVVFAHPSKESFTRQILDAFTRGLSEAGHMIEIADLYGMGFQTDMDLSQYKRETGGDPWAPIPDDIVVQQEKIRRANALAFVYPVWWSDCPAKLKGWFDRVWTYGFAYVYDEGAHLTSEIDIEKALVLCSAGHTVDHLEETGIAASMRRIMIDDRLLGVGVREARMEILGGMTFDQKHMRERNLARAYALGREF